jgi:hypothetical protein
MPRLLVNPGTSQQWEILLKPGTNTLGRSPACDAYIDHGSVSGTHCQIVVSGEAVAFKDLGSTNGTFLNRTATAEGTLAPGQRLQLGSIEMEYIADPPRTATTAPPSPMRVSLAGNASVAAVSSVPASEPPKPRLHVTTHEAPPPPPSAPASYVPDEYSESSEAPAMCKYHPKSVARFLCPQCQLHYCELCVTNRPGGERTGKFCRKCSGECVAINVQLIAPRDQFANFFASIPGAFAYPLRRRSLIFLIAGTVCFAFVDFLANESVFFRRYGWYIQAVYIGYTFAYLQRLIHTAAQGSDEAPSWPDISAFWDDIGVPFFQTLGLMLVSFGPALAMVIWVGYDIFSGGSAEPQQLLLLGIAVLGGAIYYPMALLALAMFDSIISANPLVVIPAILRMPLEYLVVLILSGALIALKFVGGFLGAHLPIPVLPGLIMAGIGLYFLTVQGRLLGLMYYAKRDKLGWFGR